MEGGVEPPHSKVADRIRRAYETAKVALLAEMISEPTSADDPVQKLLNAPVSEMRHWVGELSTSALSTATAVMALEQMRRQYVSVGRDVPEAWTRLIRGGVEWLIAHQNEDGGWGDTVKSISNISTTMLCHAVLHTVGQAFQPDPDRAVDAELKHDSQTRDRVRLESLTYAAAYIDRAGGAPAVIARYGKDRTFSVPILTHCALAGLVDWDDVISLPFELACIPAKFYAAVRLPVVSYALPALIAIGQVRFHFRPSWNPLRRWLQRWAKPASLCVLERIQPPNGGFLEATPLTSFVTMSLAAMGLHDHPVAQKGIEFIVKSARREVGWDQRSAGPPSDTSGGPALEASLSHPTSWPIDTNLATWVTTLSINALGDDVPLDARPGLRAWLLRQQYRVVHPYTNAAPGGWAWTDLPGGVPDGDDTPGAMLALMNLEAVPRPSGSGPDQPAGPLPNGRGTDSLNAAIRWLIGLQNRDGGWPTFCRGWGTLPFDRSSPDITAHALRAMVMHFVGDRLAVEDGDLFEMLTEDVPETYFGIEFLKKSQRPDGSWLPLWFGNQHAPNDENPTYGTAKVLAAFQALGRMSDESAVRGVRWLVENQNPDGGWGAGPGTPSSIEETALAIEALLGQSSPHVPREDQPSADTARQSERTSIVQSTRQGGSAFPHVEREGYIPAVQAGLSWLIARVEDGRFREPSPIGFYFAKLWYFEALYPLIFTVAALRKAVEVIGKDGE